MSYPAARRPIGRAQADLIDSLSTLGPATRADLIDHTGIRPERVMASLRGLRARGIVVYYHESGLYDLVCPRGPMCAPWGHFHQAGGSCRFMLFGYGHGRMSERSREYWRTVRAWGCLDDGRGCAEVKVSG